MRKWALVIAFSAIAITAFSMSSSKAQAANFDPCIPEICDHVERLLEHTKEQFVQSAQEALPNPKHITQVMDCLDQMLNIAMNIGLMLTWPDFSALLSQIIDQICQQIQSKWDAILSQLNAQFQLPDIPLEIFGNTYTGWLTGGISVGITRGDGVPGGFNAEINSPVGTTTVTRPSFSFPR
ncbi:MAG: hypothetical protein AAF213_05000 [Pseudomonadota bacterium]